MSTAALVVVVGCSADPEIDQIAQEQVVCARGSTLPGIDVSFWQGTINWDQVRSSGQRYAIIRAYYGANTRDSQFDRNWREARRVGLLRGAYQWFKPLQDPATQADRMVAAVGRLGPGDLPVVADVEEPASNGLPSRAEYVRRIQVWVDRVRAGTGRTPILYSGKYYWQDYVASTAFASGPLWHPQYTSASCPNIANQWSNWVFWQYSSTGRVSGISGNVDMNRFNGTMTELNALAGIVPAQTDAGVDRPVATDVPRDVAIDRPADVITDRPTDIASDRPADVVTDRPTDVTQVSDVMAVADANDAAVDDAPDAAVEDVPFDDVALEDANVVDDTPALGDAGNMGEAPVDDAALQGGCGCSAPGETRASVAALWPLALGLALSRRRVRARRDGAAGG